MQLELSVLEAQDLKQALDSRIQELRDELAHTDRREFRHELRLTLDRLEEIQRRLAPLVGG
jgi:hypothetical protein